MQNPHINIPTPTRPYWAEPHTNTKALLGNKLYIMPTKLYQAKLYTDINQALSSKASILTSTRPY